MRHLKHQVAILVTFCLAAAVYADWPEFRGPMRDGTAGTRELPTSWSNTKNIVWRSELPGEGWSSPVVAGELIYLSAAIRDASDNEPGYDLVLLIVNGRSGELQRRVSLFSQDAAAPDIHQKNSHASPTPVVDGNRVYVHFGHQGTACTTLDGEIIWRNESLGYKPVHGNGGSPIAADGLLVFSRDGGNISEVTALDTDSGKIAWQSQRNAAEKKRFSFCTPALIDAGDRQQLVLPGTDVVQSLDPQTGRELWRVGYTGYSVVPRPIFESGLVFVCTGFNRASLLAIDPTGVGDVTETHVKWKTDANVPKTASLVGFDGRVAMVSDNGIATCFEAKTGKELWRKRIGGNFSASPILAGDYLYLLNEKGVCTVLDVANEPKQIAINDLEEDCLASPAVIEHDMLIRTSEALYRIGA